MFDEMNPDRRRFLGAAAMTIAGARFGRMNTAAVRPVQSFGPLKQIDAGLLNVGYAEAGPADGPPVILLHGWPYDIHSFVDVAPLLAAAGYRVIVPYLRGYGTTRFLSADTVRNGQQAALAVDIIALMDALKIEKAIVAGFDWGARTADIIAALWPERCKALVSVSGYLIGSQAANQAPLPPQRRAAMVVPVSISPPSAAAPATSKYRHDFAKLIWQTRLAALEVRRRHLRPQRRGLRQSRPRRDRDPQLPLAARPRRGRGASTTTSRSSSPRARSSPCRPSPSRATPTAPRTRTPAPTPRNSPASTSTGPSPAASATTCRRKRRRPLPMRSWRSPAKRSQW